MIPPAKDWTKEVVTTGYWNLQGVTPLPEETTAFIEAGDAPIFVGFGSMIGKSPARITRIVLDAARRSGKRLIISAGWGGLSVDNDYDTVHVIGNVDHRSLFSKMAAIVHHGGAGTTGAAFASGRPQIVCPFVGDQPFWAQRAHALGVAPKPLPQRNLTVKSLTEAIMQTIDPAMQQRAQQLRSKLDNERGVEGAVHILERLSQN